MKNKPILIGKIYSLLSFCLILSYSSINSSITKTSLSFSTSFADFLILGDSLETHHCCFLMDKFFKPKQLHQSHLGFSVSLSLFHCFWFDLYSHTHAHLSLHTYTSLIFLLSSLSTESIVFQSVIFGGASTIFVHNYQ